MKQLLQDLKKGEILTVEVPTPKAGHNSLLINTVKSLISPGTERMLLDFGKGSLLSKARQQPEKVKQVLDKMRTDGVQTTLEAVRSKMDQPLPLGYSNVGVVQAVGANVTGFKVGQRVVSNGHHAEMVKVGKNLCAAIPDNVSDEAASFTVIASIGLQGIRLVKPELGERVVVIGVGLIGLLTVQMLVAHGCQVLAIDFDEGKLALARQFGAQTCNPAKGESAVDAGMAFSQGVGVDAVIIAAATDSQDPVTHAAQMCRKRGRIVLVGVTGLNLKRSDFYEKELSFQVSCSYGPGRYDSDYEVAGNDYPIGFVRWTEQRNFEAVLNLLATGRLNVAPFITHRFEFSDARSAYDILSTDRSALGIVLNYPSFEHVNTESSVALARSRVEPVEGEIKPNDPDGATPAVNVIGAGNYASRVLIPAFRSAGFNLNTIVSSGGLSGVIHGEKNGFASAATDVEAAINDKAANTVVIATQHDTHASFTADALRAGKHVFVEKPLALNLEQLTSVKDAYAEAGAERGVKPQLMVGFNRRFAPHVQTMKSLLDAVKAPKTFIMTMNAGAIPADHWTQDAALGGGRIIGEACHYIDLMRFLAASEIVSVHAIRMGDNPHDTVFEDKATITLGFADGSFGSIHYFANGSNSFPKERIEVFAAGRILQLDNFRKLHGYGWSNFKSKSLMRQDKGQKQCVEAFLAAVQGGSRAIPVDELFEVAKISIDAAEMLRAQ